MVLRGCTIKNTNYIIGLVIYTGNKSKIMMNSKKPPRKVSNLMIMMNRMLYTVFAFQIGIISIFASLSLSWTSDNAANHSYLSLDDSVGVVTWIV